MKMELFKCVVDLMKGVRLIHLQLGGEGVD